MKERFGDHQLQRLHCITKFSPKYLKTQKEDHNLKSEDISYLCDIYGLDSTAVASEMNSCRSVFRQFCDDVDLTDMINSASLSRWLGSTVQQPEVTPTADESINAIRPTFVSDDRDSDRDAEHDARIGLLVSLLVPLHILCCMPAYPNLLVLYKIQLSLSISNCSAERSMSRIKLIKTRL